MTRNSEGPVRAWMRQPGLLSIALTVVTAAIFVRTPLTNTRLGAIVFPRICRAG